MKTAVLILSATMLLACEQEKPVAETFKPYSFEVELKIWNGLARQSTAYLIKPELYRLKKFRNSPEAPGAFMYAYCIRRGAYQDEGVKNTQYCADTTEVGISQGKADSLLSMTEPLFKDFNLSNVDTVGRVTRFWSDDSGGKVSLHINGQRLSIELAALHNSAVTRKSQQFFVVEQYLSSWFPAQGADLQCK